MDEDPPKWIRFAWTIIKKKTLYNLHKEEHLAPRLQPAAKKKKCCVLAKETKTEKNDWDSESDSVGTNTTVPFVTSQRVAACFIPLESGARQWSQEELPLIPGEVHWQDRDTDDCCCEERSESSPHNLLC